MAKETQRFDEKTILKTPNPVFSSSTRGDKNFYKNYDLDDIPQKDDSFGILSIKSGDLSLSQDLQREREKARTLLTAIPDRLLRKNEDLSTLNSSDKFHTESTISESDLFPGNSSTPRESILSTMEDLTRDRLKDRVSMGALYTKLSKDVRIDGFDIETIPDVLAAPECSFHSGVSAMEKLQADEISWRREKDIPVQKTEFSFLQQAPSQFSMGVFFKQKSDDVSNLMTDNPDGLKAPIALIDVSNSSLIKDSINLSDIQQLLSDTKQTPGRALDYFLNYDKKDTPSMKLSFGEDEAGKENVDITNTSASNSSTLSYVSTRSLSPSPTDDLLTKKEKSRRLSPRSSSALSNLPQGRLPIETTKNELIWGCVRLGKSSTNEFIIRNRTSSRLGVKCTLANPSFRFNDGSESNFTNSMKIMLHPFESRKLAVVFAPTNIGAAADHLMFSPLDPNHKHTVKQFVKLFGYGGFGSVLITDVIKDTTGRFLLSLGNTNEGNMLKKCFTLRNNGTLPGFAFIKLNWNLLSSYSVISVAPQILVLLPEEEGGIVVTYNPQKSDFNYLKSKINSVFELGKIEITSGAEIDRGRLRKICEKAKEKGIGVNGAIAKLVQKFPGEVMPSDLKLLRESTGSIDEILRLFTVKEVVVSIEQDTDVTVVEELQNETAMFHSLCENTKISQLEFTAQPETCQVEPSSIILTPSKMADTIFLNNFSNKQLYFEVNSTPDGLVLKPKDGTVGSGEICGIKVNCVRVFRELTVFRCKILVDNECFEVVVKVLPNVQKIR